MTELAKLLYSFWNQILPTYVEGNVPVDDETGALIEPPYITYSIVNTPMFTDTLMQVRVWTYSTSYAPLMGYCDRIATLIPDSGTVLELPNSRGAVWISRGTPFIQLQPMGGFEDSGDEPDDTNYKVAYIGLVIRGYTL